MKISIIGLEVQFMFFTVGVDFGLDLGFTTHGQGYATATGAAGGGAGLGFNVLVGPSLGYGSTKSGGSTETGAIAFASLGYGPNAAGGNIQFSGSSGSAAAQSWRGGPKWGGGLGGGVMAGGYGSATAATPDLCGN